MTEYPNFTVLNNTIINCFRCPRLVAYRETLPPRPSFKDFPYWRRPVPGFGDTNAWLLIAGLAPAAHGANRAGRVFTGDLTSRFLVKALYEAGFANQPNSDDIFDGLQYTGCYLTAVVKCCPPKDKPTAQECANCLPYFQAELQLLTSVKHILVLGRTAFEGFLRATDTRKTKIQFAHGARYALPGLPVLHCTYHPSPQNTNTGKLTMEMFQKVLSDICKEHQFEA
ncbi:MAG: uracil-DNA glycosylase [Chlamydiales bacterium]|nr:uracil-DNA glycosylase [Chlamydiales bacterium]